ncbi:arsenate reductase family protein [Portibacter lacus]|nr:ArsC/Spx/MgsR family protein [Portibacter lacus]
MRKIYHLSTCNTCQRIINDLDLHHEGFEFQNIKEKHISAEELDDLAKKEGSYEALFNRRAMKYRSMGLNEMDLTEDDYRKYILSEYTFLKRPVIIIDDKAFVGNSKKVIAAAQGNL